MQQDSIDPARAAVERGDAALRQTGEAVIEDPTVFVKGAALGALTMRELAARAAARSGNAAIRDFADVVRADQQEMFGELRSLAGRLGYDVPQSLVTQDEAMLQQGDQVAAGEFDDWFLRQVLREFDRAEVLFSTAGRMEHPELAAFARRHAPALATRRREASVLFSGHRPR